MTLFRRPDPSSPSNPQSPLESSSSLESSTPVEGYTAYPEREEYLDRKVSEVSEQPAPPPVAPNESMLEPDIPDPSLQQHSKTSLDTPAPPSELVTEPIRLLSERIIVDRQRRKVGEVVVRKEIETEMVQVPVRREKLIVEQVSPDYKEIAVVPLGEGGISTPEPQPGRLETTATIQGEFTSARVASQFLAQVADQPGYERIQITIDLADPNLQPTYQQWLEHYAAIAAQR